MQFKLKIEMDNAAFDAEPGTEVAAILEKLAYVVEGRNLVYGQEGPLLDTNGNRVGFWKITK